MRVWCRGAGTSTGENGSAREVKGGWLGGGRGGGDAALYGGGEGERDDDALSVCGCRVADLPGLLVCSAPPLHVTCVSHIWPPCLHAMSPRWRPAGDPS